MSLPPCVHIPPSRPALELTLPGGATLEHTRLADLAQPALAPFTPIFAIIEAVVAVFQSVKAIPDTLGLPPDPTALLETLPELARKTDALLKLAPQLSLPYTLVGLFDAVIDALREARGELRHLQARERQLLGVADRAAELNDAALSDILSCARANIEQEAANVVAGLAAVGRLLGLIGALLEALGAPASIPSLDTLDGAPLDDLIEPIDALLTALEAARTVAPLP